MKRTILAAVVTAVFLIASVIPSGPASAGRLHPELDAQFEAIRATLIREFDPEAS